mmetsp:Transcript_51039/g.123127  ORF Transcript_51039/g.123127 Transcript_51039/m.123127 type:complete len:88 (+) Transcript_51039:557-820(+)
MVQPRVNSLEKTTNDDAGSISSNGPCHEPENGAKIVAYGRSENQQGDYHSSYHPPGDKAADDADEKSIDRLVLGQGKRRSAKHPSYA